MTLKQLVEQAVQLMAERPECADWEVSTTVDDGIDTAYDIYGISGRDGYVELYNTSSH